MRFHSVTLESVRFFVVGISITLINIILYMAGIYLLGLPPTVSAALVFIMLIPLHFYSQARVVFKSDAVSRSVLFRYIMALAVSFALNVGLVDLYWRILLAEPAVAQILGIIPAIVANYLIFKFFVFKTSQFSTINNVIIFTAAIVLLIIYSLIAFVMLYVAPIFLSAYDGYYSDISVFRILSFFK